MTWTTDAPAEPGWYWYWHRSKDRSPVCIRVVRCQLGLVRCFPGWWPPDERENVGGMWTGPIPEPTAPAGDADPGR